MERVLPSQNGPTRVQFDPDGPAALFESLGYFGKDGKLTDEGLVALAELLDHLPTIWGGGNWGPVFERLLSKIVAFSTELVVVKDGKVLLTWRKFKGTTGWHTPGSYVNPREDWPDTTSRIAKRELGCQVQFERPLQFFNNILNPRTHDLTVLAQCSLLSDPQKEEYDPKAGVPMPGQFAWFSKKPDDILPAHDKYWPEIEKALRG